MLCPICNENLEMRKVAPCFDCGHEPRELKELAKGEHTYSLFTIYGQKLVLCDFCDADFDSYDHDYFGLPERSANNYPLKHISNLDSPKSSEDSFCKKCDRRLAFLGFLKNIRDINSPKI